MSFFSFFSKEIPTVVCTKSNADVFEDDFFIEKKYENWLCLKCLSDGQDWENSKCANCKNDQSLSVVVLIYLFF